MSLKNKIISYFVYLPPNSINSKIFRSPISVYSVRSIEKLKNQLIKEGFDIGNVSLMHIVFDIGSGKIYVAGEENVLEQNRSLMLGKVKATITKDFGDKTFNDVIYASPFDTLRLRNIDDFAYARSAIGGHYQTNDFVNLPVVEANLSKMPITLSHLPANISAPGAKGGFVGTTFAEAIDFIEELDNEGNNIKKKILLRQITPFILINTNNISNATDKDWIITYSYQKYIEQEAKSKEERDKGDDLGQSISLYGIKRYLYLGWPFEMICYNFINTNKIDDFKGLISNMTLMYECVKSLIREGYKNVAETPYYINFKVNPNSFPIRLESLLDYEKKTIKTQLQFPFFKIIDYYFETGDMIIETPIFIDDELCKKIFTPLSEVFISKYNDVLKKIDVKTSEKSFDEMKDVQLEKIKVLTNYDLHTQNKEIPEKYVFRCNASSVGLHALIPTIFSVRKLTDYIHATEEIKQYCKKENFTFSDINVVIGPIDILFGQSINGGFMDEEMFRFNNLPIPLQIDEDIYISPPVIFINSIKNPNYASHTDVLIHEYTHYVDRMTKSETLDFSHYDMESEIEKWKKYFDIPTERRSHKNQIKYKLKLGLSDDEIIVEKMGRNISVELYPVVLKFKELIEEARKELEEETTITNEDFI